MNAKALIAANWKMNPRTLKEARALFAAIQGPASKLRFSSAVLCVPFPFLESLRSNYNGKKIYFGAQDVFWEPSGSFTGEVSVEQLLSIGSEYVIIGHSERRELGESNDSIARKLSAAISAELITILCVGEHERDAEGNYLGFIRAQIESAIQGAPQRYWGNIVIAYEPLWAIGRRAEDAVTSHDLHTMALYIRKVLRELLGDKVALDIPILYGGSVEPANAEELLREGAVDGFLIGHASLVATQFIDILKAAEQVWKEKLKAVTNKSIQHTTTKNTGVTSKKTHSLQRKRIRPVASTKKK
jgi:triosephosphate isomerase